MTCANGAGCSNVPGFASRETIVHRMVGGTDRLAAEIMQVESRLAIKRAITFEQELATLIPTSKTLCVEACFLKHMSEKASSLPNINCSK